MNKLIKTSDQCAVSLTSKRDVKNTMPWFVSDCKCKYPPRPANLIDPLINGERAFSAVHEAIANAEKSVDIISWGFDPSMRLQPPNGERLGALLKRKADNQLYGAHYKPNVHVRILIWKNAAAND